jgi:hypothetical protein
MSKKKNNLRMRNDDVFKAYYEPVLNPQLKARMQSDGIYWMLYRTLMEISMSRFEWEGLPPEIDKRWLELNLNFYALSVFMPASEMIDGTDINGIALKKSFEGKYVAVRGGSGPLLNLFGNPLSYFVYGPNMFVQEVEASKVVPVWANNLRTPDHDIIDIYARRMAEMDRTIEINAINARRTKILGVTTNTRQSVVNMNRQVEAGNPVIEIDTSGSVDIREVAEALDLGVAPESIISMHVLRTREWSECMTLLGINNSNQDKKERLTAAETSGNDDVIATIRAKNLKARQFACEQINEKFGLNVSVDYTTDMKTAELKDVSGGAPEDTKQIGA